MYNLDSVTVGSKIKSWRILRGLSQQELVADRFSESYLDTVESGQLKPSDDFVQYVASRLGLTIEELLYDQKAPSTAKKMPREAQELLLLNAHIAQQTGKFDDAKNFLHQLVKEHLPTSLLAQYHFTLGEVQLDLYEHEESLANLEQALKLFESNLKTPQLKLEQVRNCIALVYYQQNNHLRALQYHRQCLRAIADGKIEDEDFKLKIYYNLANEYNFVGERDLALEYYQEAVKIAEASGNSLYKARIYWGMGLIYSRIKNYTQAKLYLYRSAMLYESLQEFSLASTLHGVLGKTLLDQDELEQAETELQSSLEIALKLHDDRNLWTAYINLAYLYYKQEKQDLAAEKANLSITVANNLKNDVWLGQSLAQLARIKIAQSNIEEGLADFSQAVATLEQTDDIDRLNQVYFRYAEALENLGRLKEAMEIYKKAASPSQQRIQK